MENIDDRLQGNDAAKDAEFVAVYSQFDDLEDRFIHPVLLEMLGDPTGKIIVDYGCGEGGLASKLAGMGAEVIGMDISPEMIQSARRKARGKNLYFTPACGDTIAVPSGSVDAIVSNLVLVMIPSLDGVRKVLSECSRVLKPGGRLVFNITNPSFVDKEFTTYRNIFEGSLRYNEVGQPYQFVLRKQDGAEVTDPTFRDYHYRWEDYINAVSESGLSLKKVREIILPENEYPPYAVFLAVRP